MEWQEMQLDFGLSSGPFKRGCGSATGAGPWRYSHPRCSLSASASGIQRMWRMAKELVRTGVLQRWAYISYFAVCAPGNEAATFERIKKQIVDAVPQFQIAPESSGPKLAARK